ncbi:M14 family zinc carboxypeptidase [Lysobacter sp. M2-1]|uniref:M14 family zinc carboxypeptidase n=1 Tax=Lysobacter sp. M2-1 TaxID=2916839 RepID=UPI001F586793|nr:M14 family zinc carboxypeptidase [Lysobacter sp. M2-1]
MTLHTLAEQSQFHHTGRLDEVDALCAAFVARWPDAARSFVYGRSAEGRPMRALVVSRSGALTPEALRERGVPLLMIQAGIHPGESDGKDAGFAALRELLGGECLLEVEAGSHIAMHPAAEGLLERIAVLFVPAFNADGHERFGRWNRPNQVGPEETGWRATAHNLNLNRDYTKADAPEMQAMLALLREWDPLVCADMHVTDGADFEPDISIQVEPVNQGDPQLRNDGIALRDALIGKLAAQGSLPLPFYPDLTEPDDPSSGFQLSVYSPRFSSGYFPARNRFTVLVETHSWKDYATRMRIARNTIVGLAELMAARGVQWRAAVLDADERASRLGGEEVELDYAAGWREPTAGEAAAPAEAGAEAQVTTIEFRGYAYTRELSPISGEPVTVYDPRTPQVWRVPFRRNVAPTLKVRAPRGGYVIPLAYAPAIGEKLALHGLAFRPLQQDIAALDVEEFRATRMRFSATPFEGRMPLSLEGQWHQQAQPVAAGALFVPIAQPRARLLMALLEPQAPDSFAAWGFFNGHFEQKEYIEDYVTEIFALKMLEEDAALAAEFRRRLAQDAEFSANPEARREFFQRRHASWDARYGVYPIYRTDSLPVLA